MKKICSKCKLEKDLDDFNKSRKHKDGLNYRCRDCGKIYNKEWKIKNPEKWKNQQERIKKALKTKEAKLKIKEWFIKNKEKSKEQGRKWFYNKFHNDINFKLKHSFRTRLRDALKKNKTQKSESVLKMTGCSLIEIKEYLQNQFLPEMTWDNWGKVWEIDHIKPCVSFDLTNIEQQKQCFHYSNLRILFKTTDIAKSFGYIDQIGNRNRPKN